MKYTSYEIFDLLQAACSRKASIEFLRGDEAGDYAEPGMKAQMLSIEIVEDSLDPAVQVWKVRLDYSVFDGHNKKLESADYFDSNRVPCLTAREAGMYRPIDWLYINSESMGDFFRILPEKTEVDVILSLITENIQSKVSALGESSDVPAVVALKQVLADLPALRDLAKRTVNSSAD